MELIKICISRHSLYPLIFFYRIKIDWFISTLNLIKIYRVVILFSFIRSTFLLHPSTHVHAPTCLSRSQTATKLLYCVMFNREKFTFYVIHVINYTGMRQIRMVHATLVKKKKKNKTVSMWLESYIFSSFFFQWIFSPQNNSSSSTCLFLLVKISEFAWMRIEKK